MASPSKSSRGATPELELAAFIGQEAALVGQLSFAGNVRLDGSFEGELRGGDVVVLGPSSRVSGSIAARRVIILGGRVEADIVAREAVEIRPGAEVLGALTSPEILVDPGAKFSGTFHTEPPPVVAEVQPTAT